MGFHYFNNKWVGEGDLKISVFDLSVVRGFGCFDFLRTYKNKPFRLSDHLDRLFNSAKLIGIKVPKTKKEILEIVYEGIRKNNFKETNIKMIVTGGISTDSVTPGRPSVIIIFIPAENYPKIFYERGVKVITFEETRTLHLAKSLNYLAAVIALQLAKKKEAEEALYINGKGKIYEATRSNFFAIIDGKLVTVRKGILFGVTRQVIVEIANKLRIPVVERDIFIKEIKNFKEAFITASNKEVMPVVQIDDNKVGDGEVGPITKKLMSGYKNLTQTT
ncbi:hypothetical protein A3C25_00340 [Candidatus Roizmanbacteria bacterium RIFCSPHIGHO2_02_FULL_38_11]|uniref:Amino acid aminotransferase n=1 Tax=Candidatus Roizmanbacteria bacterium RIFCSPHIGHO2_02_FULL_38_11 TaxID=1802039 RepID=A0A1F7H2U9_9BACT|nr:MAG: hypothetical protein A3C25_00340 [Candidatus Roizmanbacteria bacterium RIFCSPHIGHO2_02_FULL_38_11]